MLGNAAVRQRGLEVETREGTEADVAFVFATWLRCYKRSSQFARHIRNDTFFAMHHLVVERILARARVTVAHPAGDPETILGYLVSEPHAGGMLVHWLYTKAPFRRLGVATALLSTIGIEPGRVTFTHWTHKRDEDMGDTDDLLRRWPGACYNPYLI